MNSAEAEYKQSLSTSAPQESKTATKVA
jgi:hypothetical protein